MTQVTGICIHGPEGQMRRLQSMTKSMSTFLLLTSTLGSLPDRSWTTCSGAASHLQVTRVPVTSHVAGVFLGIPSVSYQATYSASSPLSLLHHHHRRPPTAPCHHCHVQLRLTTPRLPCRIDRCGDWSGDLHDVKGLADLEADVKMKTRPTPASFPVCARSNDSSRVLACTFPLR